MSGEVHSAAGTGYQREAGTYDRGRPDYPAGLAGWLADTLRLGPGRDVADIGAGTGKFTKMLMATGANVTAVEPVDAMRTRLAGLPGVRALAGTAQRTSLGDASMDVLVCAQSFHWFAQRESLDEFARVLKPGARLGMVWNIRDESVDWVAAITKIITPLEGDAPRFYKGDWRKPFPHPAFGELRETWFDYTHSGPASEVIVDRFMSVSFVASASEADRANVKAQLEDLAATHPALKGRATVHFPYRTVAYDCARRG